MPFLLELKTLLDWCFTKTSLDTSQWLQLSNVYSEMFFAKASNKSYFEKKLGEKIHSIEKCICGCLCVGIIMLFLIGPLLMFSNLAMFSDYNLVTGATVAFNLKLADISTNENYQSQIYISQNALSLESMT